MTETKVASNLKILETLQRVNELAGQSLVDQASRSSQAQISYLQSRSAVLRQIADLLRLQASAASPITTGPTQKLKQALFNRQMLEEFAAGSVERCLGPEYAVFRSQRIPRIPNGALLVMDRVLEIRGTRGQFSKPSEILTEFDVPSEVWFITDNGSAVTPYAILMEMALQPCGFLSAYMGTMLISPKSNLYFRNLDGEARISRQVDLRGKTVTGWARMTGHTVNEETVIQKFDFRLETDGVPFFSGSSIFGFFPEETMIRQVGLDNGKESLPQYLQSGEPNLNGRILDLKNMSALNEQFSLLSKDRLALLDEIYMEQAGGTFGKGYIAATRQIDPQNWFFTNHFFQDPVMPGSLGVEAILETMRVFAMASGLTAQNSPSHFELVEGCAFQWKYRGQILPSVEKMMVEIQVRRVEETPLGIEIEGDASLWADSIRIYQVKNASVRIAKG